MVKVITMLMQTTHLLTKRISLLLVLFSTILVSNAQIKKTNFPGEATLRSKGEFQSFWDNYGLGRVNSSGAQFSSKPMTVRDGVLTIPFSPGDWGGAGWQPGGTIFQTQPEVNGRTIYVEYHIKFSDNFDWGSEGESYRGGKFGFGLVVGSVGAGRNPGMGNFSVTTMWRGGGTMDAYIYHAGQTSNWPDRQIYTTIERGRWYKFGIQVTLNDPGQSNGKVEIWINEDLRYDRSNFRFSDAGNVRYKPAFANFWGGNSGSWASRTNCDIQYKDISFWQSKPNGGGPPANTNPVARGRASVTAGPAPLTVNFNGSDSFDSDGNIVSYSWDFGDGNQSNQTNPTHTYTQVGNYTATLTVTDDDGARSSDNMSIQVSDPDVGTECGDLESGWSHRDIGNVGSAGNACFDNSTNTYSLTASGADIWGNEDAFHFMYQQVSGDFEIVSRVLNIENTHPFAKGGLMVREDLNSTSRYAFIATNQNNYAFEYRQADGGTAESNGGSWVYNDVDHPTYFKLKRAGSRFTSYLSEDGNNWTEIDYVDLSMPASAYVGLALTSHDNSKSNTSSFDKVEISEGGDNGGGQGPCELPQDWNSQDIGNVGVPGMSCYDDVTETYAIAASGDDIWGTEDSFHYLYQELDGNGEIIAKIDDIDETHQFAKGGVMIREKLDPGSRHAMLVLNQNQRAFQYRQTENGMTEPEAGSWLGETIQHPYWVKLERIGNNLAGYISPDGQDWTLVDGITLQLPDIIYVGLALTSHDNSTLNVGAFKDIEVKAANTTNFPVELLDFEGVLTPRGTELSWGTATESNNHRFTIERSIDGATFEKIGEMLGAGTTTVRQDYNFLDTDPVEGIMIYRLKQTDFDGTFDYLGQIEILNNSRFSAGLNVYPNPASEGFIKVEVSGLPVEEIKQVSVIDINGRTVMSYQPSESVSTVELPSNLVSGLYFVQMDFAEGSLGTRLLIQ